MIHALAWLDGLMCFSYVPSLIRTLAVPIRDAVTYCTMGCSHRLHRRLVYSTGLCMSLCRLCLPSLGTEC